MEPHHRLTGKIRAFAREYILNRSGLGIDADFPEDIWAAMGEAGLMDPGCLDNEHPCRSIAAGARAMVDTGGNLGLALSWMIHQLTARYLVYPHLSCILDNGFWEGVRSGRTTVAFAVSEPGAGAHPKFMSAAAEKKEGAWLVSGEKAYLTNGPISHCFIVIAATGREPDGRKAFSAFLVPGNRPGLSPCTPMEIPFFRPAPHGNIRLDNCRLGMDRLLGEEGRAFSDMVLPFRRLEDAAMTGAVSGAMAFVLSRAAAALTGSGRDSGPMLERLGELGAGAAAAAYLSDHMAAMADGEGTVLESLNIHFRQTTAGFLSGLEQLLAENDVPLPGRAAILVRDLVSSAKIGGTVAGIKKQKIGRRLLDNSL
ncbi:MAG: acyl-CoA/acyl-ACP dehydrogenase [Desulfobacter sp.]|nr:MAG: acyl-CoA/acyl-ACP dehydrogenase [Desulfobacter sp.]